MDARTEAEIIEALPRLMRGRTCILITHRLTPLSACDQVLSLEQGQLIGRDTGRPDFAPAAAWAGRLFESGL